MKSSSSSLIIPTNVGTHSALRILHSVFVVGAVVVLGVVKIGYARIINVPDDIETIQAGMEVVEDSDTVLVYPGIYRENIEFLGKSILVASLCIVTDNEAFIDSTIIDGDQNSSVVKFMEGEPDQSRLDGFTLINGCGLVQEGDDEQRAWGGGIICINSSPMIRRCHILENGQINQDLNVFGGGVYCEESSPEFRDCLIMQNRAAIGGGVCCSGGLPLFIDCVIVFNVAFMGGGVDCGGSASFTRCYIERNMVPEEEGLSTPGILVWGDFEDVDEPLVSFDSCYIDGNRGGGWGGGIANIGSYLRLSHSLMIANRSGSGSAIFSLGGVTDVIQSVIYGNRAWEGSMISVSNGSLMNLNSTIFYGNDANIIESTDLNDWDQENGRDYNLIQIQYCDIERGMDAIDLANENDSLAWSNENIDEDPLFADVESYDFHLTRNSPCIDQGDPDLPDDPDDTQADIGAFYFPHNNGEIQFPIALRQGWNIISSICSPQDPSITSVWFEIVRRDHLLLSKDQIGNFYYPARNFNNMQPWDVRQGYYAKMAEPDTLVIVNVPVEVGTPIPLRQGWNLAAYFPEEELDVREAFASIQEQLILVKNDEGRFFIAEQNFSNMPPLKRGKGYQVAVNEACELVYPNEEFRVQNAEWGDANANANAKPEHFKPLEMTGGNMSLLLNLEFRVENLEYEIGVFTESEFCVGNSKFTTLNSNFQIGLAIWADDPTTPEVDGAVEGEALGFRLWDGREEISDLRFEISDLGKRQTGMSILQFETDGYAEGTIDLGAQQVAPVPTSLALYPSFPNPFNSSTLIRFDLPKAGNVRLVVTDLAGREVEDLTGGFGNPPYAAGTHSVTWDASGQPSGIYLVKLETQTGVMSSKVTLIR